MAYVEDVIDMGLMGRGGDAEWHYLGRVRWYRASNTFMNGPQRIGIARIPDLYK